MEHTGICPLCRKQLCLQQINFTTAIFICLDVKCPYPVNGNCMVVKRRIENINKTVDFFSEYQKNEKFESSTNVSERTEKSIAERSLMLDLEELLNANDYYCPSETECKDVLQESQGMDDKYKYTAPNSRSSCLENFDLDDLLTELFG